jgi:hypothetical protein
MLSGGGRSAGLKSVPIVYATGNIATWVTPSGMPSTSRATSWFHRCAVVHTVPRPRERRASTKLQAAGRIDPNADARETMPRPSSSRWMQGMTSSGTSSIVFASWSALSYTRFVCASSSSVAPRSRYARQPPR